MLGRDMLNLHDLGADVDKQGLGLQEGVAEFKPKVTTTFEINQTPQLFARGSETVTSTDKDHKREGG